jgi:hypothetical protein
MTKIIQFQFTTPGKELYVLDEQGQIWHQKGKGWEPVIISLPIAPKPEMPKPTEESFR